MDFDCSTEKNNKEQRTREEKEKRMSIQLTPDVSAPLPAKANICYDILNAPAVNGQTRLVGTILLEAHGGGGGGGELSPAQTVAGHAFTLRSIDSTPDPNQYNLALRVDHAQEDNARLCFSCLPEKTVGFANDVELNQTFREGLTEIDSLRVQKVEVDRLSGHWKTIELGELFLAFSSVFRRRLCCVVQVLCISDIHDVPFLFNTYELFLNIHVNCAPMCLLQVSIGTQSGKHSTPRWP